MKRRCEVRDPENGWQCGATAGHSGEHTAIVGSEFLRCPEPASPPPPAAAPEHIATITVGRDGTNVELAPHVAANLRRWDPELRQMVFAPLPDDPSPAAAPENARGARCKCEHVHETVTLDGVTSVFHRCRTKGCECREFAQWLTKDGLVPDSAEWWKAVAQKLASDYSVEKERVRTLQGELEEMRGLLHDSYLCMQGADATRVGELLRRIAKVTAP